MTNIDGQIQAASDSDLFGIEAFSGGSNLNSNLGRKLAPIPAFSATNAIDRSMGTVVTVISANSPNNVSVQSVLGVSVSPSSNNHPGNQLEMTNGNRVEKPSDLIRF